MIQTSDVIPSTNYYPTHSTRIGECHRSRGIFANSWYKCHVEAYCFDVTRFSLYQLVTRRLNIQSLEREHRTVHIPLVLHAGRKQPRVLQPGMHLELMVIRNSEQLIFRNAKAPPFGNNVVFALETTGGGQQWTPGSAQFVQLCNKT
eukprot:1827371-Rhodomonas_salina.5